MKSPYGIGEDGSKAITRGKQPHFEGKQSLSNAAAYCREYKAYDGGDIAPPPRVF